MILNNWKTVKCDTGASADDTKDISDAMAVGGTVYLPAGVYQIDCLKFIRPGTQLLGDGEGQTILVDTGGLTTNHDGARHLVSCVDVADCSIRGLTIKGLGPSTKGYPRDDCGLLVHAAPRFRLEDVTVRDFAGRGVMVHHRLTAGCRFDRLTVTDISPATTEKGIRHGWGVFIYGGGNFGSPSDCVFSGLRVERTQQAGLILDAGTTGTRGNPPTGIRISDLTLVDCGMSPAGDAAALTLSGAHFCRVDKFTIRYTQQPPSRAIVFAKDNCAEGWSALHNAVANGMILGCGSTWAENSDTRTNVLSGIVVRDANGSVRRV